MPMFREFTMPLTPSPAVAGPRRRSFFAGALGALSVLGITTGCAGGSGNGDDSAAAEDSPAARRLRESAVRQRLELLARYDGTAAVHSGLEGRLKPLRATVAQHAEALGGADAARRTPAAGRSAPPGDEKAALAALAEAEQQGSDAHTEALTGAPPQLARLLASVAAAGAAHAYLLGKDDA